MNELNMQLFLKVQEHAALAIHGISKMPGEVANAQLLVMTDLAKASAQIAALGEMNEDVKRVGAVLHALYARISDFLSMPDDQLLSVEDLIELGAKRATEIAPQAMPQASVAKNDVDGAASGAKYRDAIRKEIAKTHENVVAKGNNVFGHDGGSYFLGFYQKSGSTAKELKFSINKDIIADLAAAPEGHLYLVGKDGLIADVAISELEGKQIDAGRWEFFVSIGDDAVTAVTGNKRAFTVEFDQFSVGVTGSAE